MNIFVFRHAGRGGVSIRENLFIDTALQIIGDTSQSIHVSGVFEKPFIILIAHKRNAARKRPFGNRNPGKSHQKIDRNTAMSKINIYISLKNYCLHT